MERAIKFLDEVLHLRAENLDKSSCSLIVRLNARSLGICRSGFGTAVDYMKEMISSLNKGKCGVNELPLQKRLADSAL